MTRGLVLVTADGESETGLSASADLLALSEKFLHEARLLQLACPDGLNLSMQMNFVAPASTAVRVNASAAEQAGVLHRLRPFVLSDEKLYLPKYLNAVRRENRHNTVLSATNFIRDAFLVRQSGIVLQNSSGPLDFDQQWQDYANAFEYHRDDEKRRRIEQAFGPMPDMASFAFWWAGIMKTKTILAMQGLPALLCGKADRFVVNLRDQEPAA